VLGFGYWAQNGVRVIKESPDSELVVVCDLDASRLEPVHRRYPGTVTTSDPAAVFDDASIDAVYIATPPATHASLAEAALRAGKHVLVEKPFTTESASALRLADLAVELDRTLMVGHTFLYSPPVVKVHDLIAAGEIGEIFYVESQRVNLGRYQDSGVLWDLGPHDLSMLTYWLGEVPTEVHARGGSFVSPGREDVVFLTLGYPSGAIAQCQFSWLSPTRLRRTTVSGSRRMVVYDDTLGAEAIRIYESGVDRVNQPETFGEFQLTYRSGDITIPRLPSTEPLRAQWEHFLECVRTGAAPRTGARHGVAIISILEAADRALRSGCREMVEPQGVPV